MGITHSASSTFRTVLAFATRHERRIGAGLFAFGFLTDLLTFTLLPLGVINIFFAAYLLLAALCTFGANVLSTFTEDDAWWKKTLVVVFPLGVQYALGGLLSGFVVFYASHSVVAVSWPFLLLLALVYFGNEYYRKQREHLIFQTVLFYFALYAYAIFALPFFLGVIGPWVFIGSTVATVLVFAVFLWLLRLVNRKRSDDYFRPIAIIATGITVAVTGAYFTGVIPPLPLALKEAGIYHAVTKISGGYRLQAEEARAWWELTPTLQVVPGAPLYAYSAVAAPASFGSTIVHRWEWKNPRTGSWITENTIAFPITGGREGGYRGYSVKENLAEGAWRVSIETKGGQVVGRVGFRVASVTTQPPLVEEVR